MGEAVSGPEALGLRWTVKRSFQQYLAGLSDGRGFLGEGASIAEDEPDTLIFEPDGPQDDGAVLAFRGEVTFVGHGGMLAVQIAAPHVRLTAGRAELTVTDPHAGDAAKRLLLVTFEAVRRPGPAQLRCWTGEDARLTEEGTELFGGVYPADEPFDPLTITLREPA